jgi:nucleotide-binding universal stress UspA family protein
MGSAFKSILVGVEGNAASTEAARQAIALAGDSAGVHFTAVYTSFEPDPDHRKDVLEASLEEAAAMAGAAGVPASHHLREARYAIDVLLPESNDHDLLVLGTHGASRAHGLVFGSTASEAAHGTERPLLIARPSSNGGFPRRIVLASDGGEGSWAPARKAAEIAAGCDAALELLHVDDGKQPEAAAVIEEQVAEIARAIGSVPPVSRHEGHATKEIVEAARERGASLIVAGRRGLKGIKSLGSVSERVVSGAHCSVLLVPAHP